MTDSNDIKAIHQRWALGESISAEEQRLLDSWYAETDALEMDMPAGDFDKDYPVDELKKQMRDMLDQIAEMLRRIQLTSEENEKLRQENERLKKLLVEQSGRRRA